MRFDILWSFPALKGYILSSALPQTGRPVGWGQEWYWPEGQGAGLHIWRVLLASPQLRPPDSQLRAWCHSLCEHRRGTTGHCERELCREPPRLCPPSSLLGLRRHLHHRQRAPLELVYWNPSHGSSPLPLPSLQVRPPSPGCKHFLAHDWSARYRWACCHQVVPAHRILSSMPHSPAALQHRGPRSAGWAFLGPWPMIAWCPVEQARFWVESIAGPGGAGQEWVESMAGPGGAGQEWVESMAGPGGAGQEWVEAGVRDASSLHWMSWQGPSEQALVRAP